MSQRINIGGIKDEHYRYTMEKLVTKIESRGNGIKTVLVNMSNVSKDLKVPPEYPTKYFSSTLGASNESKDGKFILKGSFPQQQLENVLQEFIRKFILCPKCHLPEADMSVKGDNVFLDCKACSHHAMVDPREKLVKFIVTHPPPKQKGYVHKTTKEAEDAQKTSKKTTTITDNDDDDDVEWSTDVSAEAVLKRQAKEAAAAKILEKGSDDEAEEEEEEDDGEEISPMQVLGEFLKSKPSASAEQIAKVVNTIKTKYEMDNSDAVRLLCETFFTTKADLLAVLAKRAEVFQSFLVKDKKNEKQLILLGYIEDFIASHQDLLPKVSKILEVAYDNELLKEEAILEWHGKKKSKFVKDAELLKKIKDGAKKFIDWLGSAEEEEEESAKKPAPEQKKETKSSKPAPAPVKEEEEIEEEDFDAL